MFATIIAIGLLVLVVGFFLRHLLMARYRIRRAEKSGLSRQLCLARSLLKLIINEAYDRGFRVKPHLGNLRTGKELIFNLYSSQHRFCRELDEVYYCGEDDYVIDSTYRLVADPLVRRLLSLGLAQDRSLSRFLLYLVSIVVYNHILDHKCSIAIRSEFSELTEEEFTELETRMKEISSLVQAGEFRFTFVGQ